LLNHGGAEDETTWAIAVGAKQDGTRRPPKQEVEIDLDLAI